MGKGQGLKSRPESESGALGVNLGLKPLAQRIGMRLNQCTKGQTTMMNCTEWYKDLRFDEVAAK
jgi:hypothetical protein